MKKFTNIVMDDGRVHPLAKTLPALVNNLWWNVVMDDWNLDEKSLVKWQWSQHYKSIIRSENLQEMTNNVGLAFSVGDTTRWFTINTEQDN
jgi:hypothetical protein